MGLQRYTSASLHPSPDMVIFDLDNTLYPYAPAHEAGLQALVAVLHQQYTIHPKHILKAYAAARLEIKERLGPQAAAHSRLLYAQRLLEKLGLKAQPMLSLEIEQAYWHEYLAKMQLFEHAKSFMIALRAKGITLALVTDLTTQIQFRKLIYLELDGFFDIIVTSEEAGGDKCTERPFHLLKRKLNQHSKRVWMIGDDVGDVQPAQSVFNATVFQRLGQQSARAIPGVDIGFHHYAALMTLVTQAQTHPSTVD